MNKFSISESLKFGWETTQKNFGLIVKLILAVALIYAVPSVVLRIFRHYPFLYFVFSLVSWYIQIRFSIAMMRIAIKFAQGHSVIMSDLWFAPEVSLILRYLLGGLFYGVIVVVGLILLIVPGIIFAIKYQFFGYLIVDKDMQPMDALKRSAKMSSGIKWELFLLGIVFALINVVGALAFGIGLLATIPTTMIAHAYVYKKLEAHLGDANLT